MPYVREADVENPALLGKPHKAPQDDEKPHCCSPKRLLRTGWIWALVVAGVLLGTIIPIGLKDRRHPTIGTPSYNFTGGRPLNTTILYDPMSGLNGSEPLSCTALQADLPNATIPVSSPPPPVKLLGDRLVTVDGGKDVSIHGINWFGYNNGKTFVDGLDGEKLTAHTWEGGDFATIVHQLRLLGFNAVRLPFLFSNLYTQPPQDYSKPCPQKKPTAEDLAKRTTAPDAEPTAPAPALSKNLNPPGSQPGVCNAYVPMGVSTLARFLWTVDFLVANGLYVLVDYHPEAGNVEPVTNSPQVFAHNWLRLWAALTCLPNWEQDLQGRVFLDLLNEPDGVKLLWEDGKDGRKGLGQYYVAAMDAIDKHAGGNGPIYFIQGTGQEKAGSNWGDGFITDKAALQERALSDPNGFFTALLRKPYRNRVVLSPHLYGPSLSNNTYNIGEPQWKTYSASWGTLQKDGYCSPSGSSNSTAACQKFPVVIGEVGSNFTLPADTKYFDSLVKYMRAAPPADKYASAKFDRWFWWVYNANSKEVGGIVGRDWHTLDWKKLQWMQDNLGLTPWYKQGAASASTEAAAAVAAPADAPAATPK